MCTPPASAAQLCLVRGGVLAGIAAITNGRFCSAAPFLLTILQVCKAQVLSCACARCCGCKREAQGRRRGAAEHVTAISGAAVGSPGVMFGFLVFGDPSSGVLSINELLGLELRIGIRALGLQLGSGFLH